MCAGLQLKPLLSAGSGSGHGCSAFLLPASFVGAHMEVDDSSLASLLPLQPNGSAMLPVRLLVGRAPRNTSLEDFTLEVSEGHQDWQAVTIGHSGKMLGPRKFVLKKACR